MTFGELKAQPRWLVWRYEPSKTGKPTKVPHCPSGRKARTNDPSTWTTYAQCAAVVSRFSGIGLTTGNGVVSTDLDDVIVNGEIIPEAMQIVTVLDSYTEVSPSGTGLVIFACGVLPGPGFARTLTADSAVEIKDVGFFHSFTGRHLEGTPVDLMDREPQLETLYHRFHPPVRHIESDGIARPEAVQKFIRRFTAYAETLGAEITAVKTVNGKTLVLTSPCLLHDDHDGGVGITADGIRCVQCFHTRCAVGWAQWSRMVEEKYAQSMRLDGEIKWKK